MVPQGGRLRSLLFLEYISFNGHLKSTGQLLAVVGGQVGAVGKQKEARFMEVIHFTIRSLNLLIGQRVKVLMVAIKKC